MKKTFIHVLSALSACAILGFSSCEKIVILDNDNLAEGTAKLTLTTRSDDSTDSEDEGTMPESQIYIFRQTGKCAQMLTTDGETNAVTVQLAAGTYTICAVAGDDLERFTLPTLTEATTTSVVKLQEGKVMNSFFSKQISVTLDEGTEVNKNISLDRKVICLDQIEIKNVPSTVTAVEITLSSFYNSIQLDGTFPSSPTTTYQTALAVQSDGTTWKATPNQLLFPSVGNPTINISFTTANSIDSYSYTMESALEANHHYDITGTYKLSQAKMSFTLTATDWDEDCDNTFEFSDHNMAYNPVAGEYCNGYYVVSVDEQTRTAVLLSEKVSYNAPAAGNEENQALWREELEAQMADLDKPTNITGTWRLPTIAEVEIFTKDPQAVTFDSNGISAICFCENGEGKLVWAYTQRNKDNTYTFVPGTIHLTSNVRLRPVIDITY